MKSDLYFFLFLGVAVLYFLKFQYIYIHRIFIHLFFFSVKSFLVPHMHVVSKKTQATCLLFYFNNYEYFLLRESFFCCKLVRILASLSFLKVDQTCINCWILFVGSDLPDSHELNASTTKILHPNHKKPNQWQKKHHT